MTEHYFLKDCIRKNVSSQNLKNTEERLQEKASDEGKTDRIPALLKEIWGHMQI